MTRVSIRDWLNASNLESVDAQSLLCHVLGKPRSYLFSHSETLLSEHQSVELTTACERRCHGEPLSYITGVAEFWSMPFLVTPDVLIPRDDTGCLVEVALELWNTTPNQGTVVDAGTGSGAVAIAFAKETGEPVLATDFSAAALKLASTNASRLSPGLIDCVQANWLDPIAHSSVRLLLSNPPYIPLGDPHLTAIELQHEPTSALVSGNEGLDDLKRLAVNAPSVLISGGAVALEHGYDQANAVQALLREEGFLDVATVQDLSGNDRVTHAKAP